MPRAACSRPAACRPMAVPTRRPAPRRYSRTATTLSERSAQHRCCGARRAALGVGTGTAGRDAAAGFGATGAAGLPTAADGARPRSDETFMPALRNTSSAALAPPARRGEVWAADGGSCCEAAAFSARGRPAVDAAVSDDADAAVSRAGSAALSLLSCGVEASVRSGWVRDGIGGRVVPRSQRGRCASRCRGHRLRCIGRLHRLYCAGSFRTE